MEMNIVAVDQGTTATKAHALWADGVFSSLHRTEHRQIRRQPGWVEHDPVELLGHIRQCLDAAPRGAVVALANQGETVIAWDGATGEPIYNAIVWQDLRTEDMVARLRADGAEAETLERAGLPLDSYFSASKLAWIMRHVPGAERLRLAGRLRLGTSDAFFLNALTGKFVTDVSTASRTSLMNLHTLEWDPDLCALFGIPLDALPEICATVGDFGGTKTDQGSYAIRASVVDQQAALYGHGCHEPGRLKITFGTGAFALAVVGSSPKIDPTKGLLPTVAWQLPEQAAVYAIDGGLFAAAAALNWARGLGLFGAFSEIGRFTNQSAVSRGLVFVPALTGLGSPHWDRSAAGLWLGLRQETTREDMIQSVLEGVAMRAAELHDAVEEKVPQQGDLVIDGGMSRNSYFCQFLANVVGRRVAVPAVTEMTSFGAAALARAADGNIPPTPTPRALYECHGVSRGSRDAFAEAVACARHWGRR